MPNRIIKECICESESLSQLNWFEQVLFFRLIVLADDFGNYDGRIKIIRGRAFPLEDVSYAQIVQGMDHLEIAGCILRYTVDGKPYVNLPTWGEHQRVRESKHKYPSPEDADTCGESRQVAASCGELRRVAAR